MTKFGDGAITYGLSPFSMCLLMCKRNICRVLNSFCPPSPMYNCYGVIGDPDLYFLGNGLGSNFVWFQCSLDGR